jgi:GNAT superfamily N-acetyltransferase
LTGALEIRRARPEEAETLTAMALWSKASWGYDDAFMALCRDELTVGIAAIHAGDVWVAVDGGMIVGLLEVAQEPEGVEVEKLFVSPDHQKEGVGAALWRRAERSALAAGLNTILTDADPNAVGFYRRMGMHIVGQSRSGSIPGRVLPRMAKSLPVNGKGKDHDGKC